MQGNTRWCERSVLSVAGTIEEMLMTPIRSSTDTRTLGWRDIACAFMIASFAATSYAQAPAASGNAPAPAATPEQLEKLVGPIALYPDDLVAIILPASTSPLQLVQADRFLDKRKADPKLPIDDKLDDAVKSLLNYPEVVKKMSGDLDWTVDLGEAVVADQGAVLDAIQAFRRKTQAAGNLKTDDKQVIVVEKEVVKIVPANPQVIYVPQYNPSSVVVYSSVPVWGYYPAPYPSYYYPYPPGAALATGLIWGAAIGAAWNGGHWNTNWGGGNNNITINRGGNTINTGNINTGNINRGGASASQRPANTNTAWKSDKRPGQVSGSTGRAPSTGRVGDSQLGGGGGRGGDSQIGGGGRASTQPAGGGGRGGDSQFGGGRGGDSQVGGGRASTQPAGGGGRGGDSQFGGGAGAGARDRSAGGGGGGGRDAFGSYGGSGRQASMDSSRGASSRSSMAGGGGGGRSASAGAASRGGGGARGGGGGRGGGRR
jgi:hypothetical protein